MGQVVASVGWGGRHTRGVPVLGVTDHLGELSDDDVVLGEPIQCAAGDRITHLVLPTRMSSPGEVGSGR